MESPPNNYVNCASATAEQMLTSIGGRINVGVTHCDHLGQRVSVDHIFLRLRKRHRNAIKASRSQNERCAALALGYLDDKGTRVLNVRRGDMKLEGSTVLSDHRPITAKIAWPRRTSKPKKERLPDMYLNATMPLDPLQPAWGIVEPSPLVHLFDGSSGL